MAAPMTIRRVSLLSLLVLTPSTFAQHAVDATALRAVVQHAFDTFHPVGLAVAIVQGDDVVLEMGLGERVAGSGEPILPGTPFNIASCTKAFTAATVGKLVAEGRLAWDDPVNAIVPRFRLADPWITRHLTVRDLLCHRSGLKTFEGDLLWYGTSYTDDEVLARMDRLPITRRFREQFGYQNLLYMVAGRVVGAVSGRDWPTYVHEELLQPLGMTCTAVGTQGLPQDAQPAMPHIGGERIEPVQFQACQPAGAIWSSASDMTRWMRMLLSDGQWEGRTLLPPDVLHACWTPHTIIAGGRSPIAIEDFNAYGLGWFLAVFDGKKFVEHDGGMPGYLSKVTLVPADRFGLVILNNTDRSLLNLALRRAIMAERSGEDGKAMIDRYAKAAAARADTVAAAAAARVAARVPDTTPTHALSAYAGRYRDAVLGDATVELAGDALRLVVLPAANTLTGELTHWHHDVFRVDFPDRFLPFALVQFELDVKGEVAGFRIDCPIDDFDFAALDFRRLEPDDGR